MKSLEQMKAQQAREIANLEAKHALAAKLPIMPWFVLLAGKPGNYHSVSIKVEGIRGAIEAIKAFTVVPFAEHRDGCLSLVPMEFVPESKRDKTSAQWAFQLKVDTHFFSHCGAGTNLKIQFYARVAGAGGNDVVSVTLDVKGPGYIGSFNQLAAQANFKNSGSFGHGRAVVYGSVKPNSALNGACQRYYKWASGSEEWANFSYLISTELEGVDVLGSELVEPLNILRNLSDEFDAKVEG
jgi:hypothetical protein